MQVIAIDPAPKKDSTVFDGAAFLEMDAPQLRRFLQAREHQNPETLVCWDAPLTGPRDPENAGNVAGDFSQRCIEQFFSRQVTGDKACPGISVRPYSQCPHWTITRSVLGLPRTGPYDNGCCTPRYVVADFSDYFGPVDTRFVTFLRDRRRSGRARFGGTRGRQWSR